jgi:endonuclease YncB( thermonuclease family)
MNNKNLVLIILLLIVIFNFVFIINYFNPYLIGEMKEDLEIKGNKKVEVGFVSKVIDGDTVIINGESVRLLGMDTDERGEECYNEAKERLEELVLDKEVNLESGVKDKDHYKRLLRWIFVNDENINLLLVEEGLAIARFYEDVKYKTEIINAEQEARSKKIGCKWNNL